MDACSTADWSVSLLWWQQTALKHEQEPAGLRMSHSHHVFWFSWIKCMADYGVNAHVWLIFRVVRERISTAPAAAFSAADLRSPEAADRPWAVRRAPLQPDGSKRCAGNVEKKTQRHLKCAADSDVGHKQKRAGLTVQLFFTSVAGVLSPHCFQGFHVK